MPEVKSIIFDIFLMVVMINLVGFFAESETAFLSLNPIKIKSLVATRQKGALLISRLKSKMDSLLTLILIGTNFCSSLASSLASSLCIAFIGDKGAALSTFVVAFLVTAFGQIIPKTIASHNPQKVATKNSLILYVLMKVITPLVFFFGLITKVATFMSKVLWKKNDFATISTDDIKSLIEITEKEGTIKKEQSLLLHKAFSFENLTVHSVMKHRFYLQSIKISATKDEVIQKFISCGLKNLAVTADKEEDADIGDALIGTVYYKDVLYSSNTNGDERDFAKSVMKDILFIPQSTMLLNALTIFKKEDKSVAFALDEAGCFSGTITVDDILKVVFGRITLDEEHSSIMDNIKFISPNEFIIAGNTKLSDINDTLKLSFKSENYCTLAGLVLELCDCLPVPNQSCSYKTPNGTIILQVQSVQNNAIESVKVLLCPPTVL